MCWMYAADFHKYDGIFFRLIAAKSGRKTASWFDFDCFFQVVIVMPFPFLICCRFLVMFICLGIALEIGGFSISLVHPGLWLFLLVSLFFSLACSRPSLLLFFHFSPPSLIHMLYTKANSSKSRKDKRKNAFDPGKSACSVLTSNTRYEFCYGLLAPLEVVSI